MTITKNHCSHAVSLVNNNKITTEIKKTNKSDKNHRLKVIKWHGETSSLYCSPPSGINVFCHSRCFFQRWRNCVLQLYCDMLKCSTLRRYMLSSGYPHMNIDTACSRQFPSPYTHNMPCSIFTILCHAFQKEIMTRMNSQCKTKLILILLNQLKWPLLILVSIKCYVVYCQYQWTLEILEKLHYQSKAALLPCLNLIT